MSKISHGIRNQLIDEICTADQLKSREVQWSTVVFSLDNPKSDSFVQKIHPTGNKVFDYLKLHYVGFQWLKKQGGLAAMGTINERKASKLYAAIDGTSFYSNPVEKASRSWMNVPFVLASADLDNDFLAGATEAGLTTLEGHRSVGGMRASIYNAMPEAGVDALIDFMADFEKRKA